jgi:hypothetical protein
MIRRTFVLAAVAAMLVLPRGATAQNAPPTELRLRGIVIDDARQVPLKRARVSVTWHGGASGPVLTDADGRFEASVGTAVHLTIAVSKAGYAPLGIGREGDAPPRDVEVRLVRGSVLAGVVLESDGAPAVDRSVLVRRTDESGTRYGIGQYTTTTDDRGEFRVGSLAAGAYAVLLTDAGPRARVVLNAPVDRETVVRVGPGEERWLVRFAEPNPGPASAAQYVLDFNAFNAGADAARMRSLTGDARPVTDVDGGTISGRAFHANGRPAFGIVVQAIPIMGRSVRLAETRMAATDADGRYTLASVPAGTYRLVAGQVTNRVVLPILNGHSGAVIAVSNGGRRSGLDITLPPGGVVTGAVRDDLGEPVEGILVRAWQARLQDGRRLVSPVYARHLARTDDRGRFRLFGLARGTYYVGVSEAAEGNELVTFHPGSHDIAGASTIHVAEASEAAGADVLLAPVPLGGVRGRIVDSRDVPFSGPVTLSSRGDPGRPVLEPRVSGTSDGTFLFADVPPGDYVVQAGSGLGSLGEQPREFVTAFTTIAGDEVASLFIQTSAGSSISGHLLVRNDPATRPPAGVTLVALPADPDRSPVQPPRLAPVDADGAFVMTSLFGPLRFVLQNAPPGWRLHTVQIDGVNAAEDPVTFGSPGESRTGVTVLLERGEAGISGRVTGSGGAGALVLVFPADRRRWHARSGYLELTTSDEEGRFVVSGLPAGDYRVAALQAGSVNMAIDEWRDPDLLASLLLFAGRVTLDDDGRGTVDVRALRR